MIHYQLRCGQDHEFDGWFKDSAAFERQAKLGLVECPTCGEKNVTRALMAPAVAKRSQAVVPVPAPQPPAPAQPQPNPHSQGAMAAGPLPDHLRTLLQRMRQEVEKNCEYVGPQFADEARKIHHGESDPRGIYGEATSEQAESLAEEGIQVARIPWVPRADG
jgi:hypothetical protein